MRVLKLLKRRLLRLDKFSVISVCILVLSIAVVVRALLGDELALMWVAWGLCLVLLTVLFTSKGGDVE